MEPIDPEQLNSRVQRCGWIPLALLGEGGGGKVYLCAKAELVKTIEELMQETRGSVSIAGKRSKLAGKVIKDLSNSLVTRRDALAALKIPKANGDSAVYERLKREITAMSAINHPALIRLFTSDENNPPEWFAMECHSRGTLNDSVALYQGDIVNTLQSIRPIAEAIAQLHKKGFIHRDIKPNNIFLTDRGNLVLGDFGIVFPREGSMDRLTTVEQSLFSRDWIPDWARFSDATPQPKIDVFMLAKVIYFMATGGEKVLASQLDEDEFDISIRLHESNGAVQLQKFLLQCITTKEKNCKRQLADLKNLITFSSLNA